MHFEILIEDQSGKKTLDVLVPKIIGEDHTFRIIAYKGIGHTPKNLKKTSDPAKRLLLNQLPKLLNGYGKAFADYQAAVIVVADLDGRDLKEFRAELLFILENCERRPETTKFCFAVEEGEAWLLGDLPAVKKAYPKAKDKFLRSYVNGSICGTWEKLADAVYPGGSTKLSKKGWQTVGKIKSEWAKKITSHMNPPNNKSPSFGYFIDQLGGLTKH